MSDFSDDSLASGVMSVAVELSSFKVSSFVNFERALRSVNLVPERSRLSISKLLIEPRAVENSQPLLYLQKVERRRLKIDIYQ